MKIGIQEGKIDDFMKVYHLFSKAEGIIICQFYKVTDESNDIIAMEKKESEDVQKEFMGRLSLEEMGELFAMLIGKPEAYMCEEGDLIDG